MQKLQNKNKRAQKSSAKQFKDSKILKEFYITKASFISWKSFEQNLLAGITRIYQQAILILRKCKNL